MPKTHDDALDDFRFVLADGSSTIMWRAVGYEQDHLVLDDTAANARRLLAGGFIPPDREDWGSGLPLSQVHPVPLEEIRMWDIAVHKRNGSAAEWAAHLAGNHEVEWAIQADEERSLQAGDFPDPLEIQETALDIAFGRSKQVERHPGINADDARGNATFNRPALERGWHEQDIVAITEAGPAIAYPDRPKDQADFGSARALQAAAFPLAVASSSVAEPTRGPSQSPALNARQQHELGR